jgi:hypothetical protein
VSAYLAFGARHATTIGCFPDKLPIGIEKQDTSRFVFMYLVNRRVPVDFRQFLMRHTELFRGLHHWTVRLLLPRPFRRAVALCKAAVREQLWTPLNPNVSKSLEAYFRERQEQGGHLGDPSDRYIAQEFRKQGMPKIKALYRAWRRSGDRVLWQSCSVSLRDDWTYDRSAVEAQPLNRQYLQLTGSIDRDLCAKRGAKRKSRQVGSPRSIALFGRPLVSGCSMSALRSKRLYRSILLRARDKYDHFALRSHLQSLGISLRSATEPIDDTSTGKLMEGVLAAFAQFDNDVRSDRTRAGMKAALELGRWVFLAPIGYLNAPRSMGRSLVHDPERAALVQRAFEEYATGRFTKEQLLERVRSWGLTNRRGKPLTSQAIGVLLRNQIYAGIVDVPEYEVRGKRGDC